MDLMGRSDIYNDRVIYTACKHVLNMCALLPNYALARLRINYLQLTANYYKLVNCSAIELTH